MSLSSIIYDKLTKMAVGNIKIINCKDKDKASKEVLEILLEDINQDTLLLLSGGTSPDLLYKCIVKNGTLKPGAVALIDERFGAPLHNNSNEKMIAETGLLEYFNKAGIEFHFILSNEEMEESAFKYEQIIKDLFRKFPKKVAVMGIGADVHTAGMKPGLEYDHTRFVVSYDDVNGPFGKRISLTFDALAEIGEFIILTFGENKKEALEKMFQEKDQQQFPAVFFTKIPAKVILITDVDLAG